ncbi:MAG: (2Fe-2S)-binding protein [Actinobacteria bacterium]|nr:(2Fe-2S)-binding protein [Actinomycetota bacterium]
MKVEITINGRPVAGEVDERTLLLEFVRDVAGLTGARNGCLEARCGCCSVLLDGQVVKSCNVLAAQADGREVETVEGLATGDTTTIEDPTTEGSVGTYVPLSARGVDEGSLHPLQQAFHERGALQCGYCTAGMLLTLKEFLARVPDPTEAEVREALRGNLCRCTGYQSIVDAALLAAERMRG